jgi:hypothetical protein
MWSTIKYAKAVTLCVAVALLVWTYAMAEPPKGDASTSNNVTLTALNCVSVTNPSQPSVSVHDVSTREGKSWAARLSAVQINTDRAKMQFSLPAGTYNLVLTWGTCTALFDVTSLPNLVRHLTVATDQMIFYANVYHNSLSGASPFPNMTADVIRCVKPGCDVTNANDIETRPVVVDERAYYANALTPYTWYLRIFFDRPCEFVVLPTPLHLSSFDNYVHATLDVQLQTVTSLWIVQRAKRCRG